MSGTIRFENIEGDEYPPMIDVRSPSEFGKGHIPGSINIPLFSDEERAVVGTAYKRVGKDNAVIRGLEYVGPKMAGFVRQAKKYAKGRELIVLCWRGGMRSQSFVWLLNTAGVKATRIQGGYKAYRGYVRSSFEKMANLVVLGGFTGSGKTDYIKYVDGRGIQTLDLEGVANHKGSAFGHINEEVQPTNEQFENNLYEDWKKFDLENPILIENESSFIGGVSVPRPLFEQMLKAPVISMNVPQEKRIERLVRDYTHVDKKLIIESCEKIGKRLGGQKLNEVIELINNEDFATAGEMLLGYYDRYYLMGLDKRSKEMVHHLNLFLPSMSDNADLLIEKILSFK